MQPQQNKRTGVGVKGLIIHNGLALIVRRSQTDTSAPGMWEYPGGRLEFAEIPEDGLRREIMEETGLHAQIGRILYASNLMKDSGAEQIVILNYLAMVQSNAVHISSEHDDWHWATQTEMRAMLGKGIVANMDRYAIWSQPDIQIHP